MTNALPVHRMGLRAGDRASARLPTYGHRRPRNVTPVIRRTAARQCSFTGRVRSSQARDTTGCWSQSANRRLGSLVSTGHRGMP